MNKKFLLILLAGLGFPAPAGAREVNLVQNPGFETVYPSSKLPVDYELEGAAFRGYLGGWDDYATNGIIFPGNAPTGGSVGQLVRGIDQSKGRWISFRFRGLAEDGFSIPDNSLEMKIEFYSKNGTNYLDCASRPIYGEIERDRKNLTVNGDHHLGGAAVWRSYELEELLPFREVDAVRISVLYRQGVATRPQHAAFLIDDFSLVQRARSLTGRIDPAERIPAVNASANIDIGKLISLGGRWYYEPDAGETAHASHLTVTEDNSDRLFYKSDRLINPFLNNMTAWLRAGYLDERSSLVTEDKFVPDNVVITFKGDGFLTMITKGLPNHPTAKFPGFNPNHIQEKPRTYRLPLEPVLNPDAVAVNDSDRNDALPMGPIGVAINGVVFFNPFDAGMQDASNIMDYCCGHPSPDSQYHYHKYPICVNTPFVDKGDGPSEVIGFAFDGLPIYGPYQEAGIMAKDSTTNPLNAFNACYDPVRGWHYHVTPGKFPYIIGGYFAKAEPSDFRRRPLGPPGGGPPSLGQSGPPPDPRQ
ncbi:MAG TPA: YHYH protein [Candidatus Methylacidiphilales bacterium]|nr:YHYH protein [Candidatus Methylacidiphilales bacterium]